MATRTEVPAAIGLSAAVVPAALVYAGMETLALTTLVGVTPFALALWLRAGSPHVGGGRTLRLVGAVLLASLLIVFAEYLLIDRDHRVDRTQLLGLGAAGAAGMGVAVAGAAAGGWLSRRQRKNQRPPGVSTAAVPVDDDRTEECPVCGRCYGAGTGRCEADGSALRALNVPRVLANRYALERRLGQGGMATVYAARDTALNRRVAAKLMREDLVFLPDAAERFQREAQAAAAFNHPNVVTVFDYGVSGAQAFLIMELLTGSTLREQLDGEPIAAARALALLRDVASAVDAAHQQQMLHRDLKPENIFVVPHAENERAKVLDFGLAKLAAPLDAAPRINYTTGGAAFGTPLYMAPEQLRGEAPHQSWDLWALAVIAFEMLAGAHPFAAMSLAVDPRAAEPAPDSPLARLPRRCQEFFAGALAIDRSRRPPSATLFFSELERSLDG